MFFGMRHTDWHFSCCLEPGVPSCHPDILVKVKYLNFPVRGQRCEGGGDVIGLVEE